MATLIESMTHITGAGFTIRCWRQEERYDLGTATKTHSEIQDHFDRFVPYGPSITDVAQAMLKMDRMNAVEVLSDAGIGVVLYKDWP